MLVGGAMLVLLVSLWSCVEAERREARLRSGAPAWADLARITGISDPQQLARLPGVWLAGGRPRFDPACRGGLPAHPAGSLFDHRVGHGLSLSFAIAALGASPAGGAATTLGLVLAGAAGYQFLARLYALAIWVDGRTQA
jgi:hypothetical protein